MNNIEEEIRLLSERIAANPADADAYYRRGTLRWRLQQRAGAITDLNTAARLNPQGPAPAAVANLNAIMNFFNPDLYNP